MKTKEEGIKKNESVFAYWYAYLIFQEGEKHMAEKKLQQYMPFTK